MKKIYILFVFVLVISNVIAQLPGNISYQAVIRNANNNLVTNQNIRVRLSILNAPTSTTPLWQEVQTPNTNHNGLISLQLGQYVAFPANLFRDNGTLFLKTEVDPTGGTSYSISGTSQLLSTPYAMYARDVENNNDADADPTNELQTISISGTVLTLSHGGGSVVLPSSGGGGDNWGTQVAITNSTLTGSGTTASPLGIAQQSASTGQVLKWNGSTWLPQDDETGSGGSNPTGPAGGDLTGNYPNPLINFPLNKNLALSATPFYINNTGTASYTIHARSTQGYGIYGQTSNADGSGVLGDGTGEGISSGVSGRSGESSYPAVPSNIPVGVRGRASAGVGVMGQAISGTGGQFGSQTGKALVTTQGGVQFIGLGEANGRVLTCDAQGNATWQAASASQWISSGNNIYYNVGNVGIGTATPVSKLDVTGGDAQINGATFGRGAGGVSTNTASGSGALAANTTGNNNVANGYRALHSNTIGYFNLAFGVNSLYMNTSGNSNSAFGHEGLYSNTTGYHNSAIGLRTLYSNTNGYGNTAIAPYALYYNTSGSTNTAVGRHALYSNTIGSDNVSFGVDANYGNTTGQNNSAFGASSLKNNTTGQHNTMLGFRAGYNNSVGSYNVSVGSYSLGENSTGSNLVSNVAVGYRAGALMTTGYGNVVIGEEAGKNITTGFDNVWIGKKIGTTGAITFSNTIAIGSFTAVPSGNNRTHIGNTSMTWIGGQVSWSTYSDQRFKNNVKENVPGLDFILNLKPVTYNWAVDGLSQKLGVEESYNGEGCKDIEKISQTGFLAQQVEQAARSCGFEFSGIDKTGDIYSLRYAEFVVPLTKAIQEQQAIIEKQQQQIDMLQQQIDKLKSLQLSNSENHQSTNLKQQ